MKDFNIEQVQDNGVCIVKIMGELDASSSVAADTFIQDAIATETRALIIDCTDLEYISSAGIGVLLAAYHTCQQEDILFILIKLQPKIKDVLNIIGLANIFTIQESLPEAMAFVKSV